MSGFNFVHVLSILVCCLLMVGVLCRRVKVAHMIMMPLAMGIDLGLILYVEFGGDGGVVGKALGKMGGLMVVHVVLSVGVLGLYAVQIVTGLKKARGLTSNAHAKVMPALLLLRVLNLVTSIMVMR